LPIRVPFSRPSRTRTISGRSGRILDKRYIFWINAQDWLTNHRFLDLKLLHSL
jgi:hypothetical protein